MSSPDIKTPSPVQQAVAPDAATVMNARKTAGNMNGGTLLTGPSGIDNSTTKTASTTLLGG